MAASTGETANGFESTAGDALLHGASAQLPERLPDLIFWVPLPLLGATGAGAERERVRRSMRKP